MLKIVKISPEEWTAMGENFHRAVFDEIRPAYMNRIDFALIVDDGEGNALAYCTAREFDHESIYVQYSGKFDHVEAHRVVEIFGEGTKWLLENYKRVSCLVKNDNIKFLKVALHIGYKVIGIRVFGSEIFLDMLKERE